MVNTPQMLLHRITSGKTADLALLRADSPAGRAACAILTLRAEKQHAESLFDTALGALAGARPFVIINANGDILRLDDRTVPLLGLSGTAEEHVCRPLASLPGQAGSIGSLAERALREKHAVYEEVSGLPGHSSGTCLLVTAEPLMTPSGSMLGACIFLTDLTEQRELEREAVARKVHTAEMTTQSLRAAQQVSDASEHLAERIQSANAGATQQQERTTETATAMEQMNATVMEVARSAGEAAELASTTREHSSRGAERMQHLEHSIAGGAQSFPT
ncbi:methyl-accepting chemotaxis protein [Desulfovibrio psychrotolerans]|uniref:methyl-accepting chemotaxis protein n=1 Tax=Desulfovibrio psychrotolerans TaxID=415242 RepID=UPI00157B4566|nr:methyl-accepting chemotaxis protein [Desulfovibrio psychrotolerans]